MTLDIGKLVEAFLKCRDSLSVLRRAFDKEEIRHKAAMEVIADKIGAMAAAQGVDSFKTSHGTAFKAKKEFVNVEDWDVALKYIVDNDLTHMLTKKVTKTASMEYRELNDNKLPPGLKYGSTTEIQVRRK